MAPVKPMGDSTPKTKPGETGFPQKYNEEGPKPSDLNPDVVTENSVLPTPASTPVTSPKAKKASDRRTKK